jgi:sugar transferase (PEP-CTERM/EpsH1 system associated)
LSSWAHAVTLVTAAEVEIYRRFCQPGRVQVVTNGVDLDYFGPEPQSAEEICVFVGAFDYPPNIDGACWFARDVWPEVRNRRPQARLWLVGRRPVAAVRGLASLPGVEIHADVADVRAYVRRAAVAVAPLRIARGVQNKVLEAMAMARAVVTSPQTLAGVGARAGVELLAASAPHEWADAVTGLLADAEQRRRLGEAARRYVVSHHRWEQCLAPLGALMGLDSTPSPLTEPGNLPAPPGPIESEPLVSASRLAQ